MGLAAAERSGGRGGAPASPQYRAASLSRAHLLLEPRWRGAASTLYTDPIFSTTVGPAGLGGPLSSPTHFSRAVAPSRSFSSMCPRACGGEQSPGSGPTSLCTAACAFRQFSARQCGHSLL